MKPQPSHILSGLPIVIAIGFLFGVFSVSLTEFNAVTLSLATVASAILYGIAIFYVNSLQEHLWQGYVHLASSLALLTTGLANALYIIISVSVVVSFVKFLLSDRQDHNRNVAIKNAFGWIGLSGITVIVEFLVYTVVFNQSLPFATLTTESIVLVVITLAIGNAASVFAGAVLTQQSALQAIRNTIAQSPPIFEIILLFVTAIIAAVLYQVNELTFGVIVVFTVAQVIYSHNANVIKRESSTRLHELTTLNAIAQAVSVNLELDDVLSSVYTEVNELVDANTIFVAFYDSDSATISYPLVKENGQTIHWHDRRLSNGLTDYVIRNKQQLQIHKTEADRIVKLNIEADMVESSSYLGIPMMVGEKIIGVMGFLHTEHTNILQDTSLNVLQSIVNQASLALRNATLYDHTTKLATNLSRINRSVQNVMFNLNREDALHAAAQTAQRVTNADQVAIFLVDMQDKITLNLTQFIGTSEAFRERLSSPELEWFDTSSNYRLVDNIDDLDDPDLSDLALIGNFRAFAEIPMRSGTTSIGYLMIYHHQPHHYQKPEVELLEMLASQITVALDNSELLHALEIYASEQAELVHLSNITSSSLELESVINDVSKALINMLEVTRVDVGLYTQGRNDIHIYSPQSNLYLSMEEQKLDEFAELQIDPDNHLQYPKIMLDSDDSLSSGAEAYMEKHGVKSLTITPMMINNEVIGSILLSSVDQRIFQDNERRLLEMASAQIAAQIHNAQIHTLTEEALVKRLGQLALIEDIIQKISRSLDSELVIENVLEAALRFTQADIASLALVVNDATVAIRYQEINDEHEIIAWTTTRPSDEGIIGQVLRTGRMHIIEDNYTDSVYITPSNDKEYMSSLTVPLTKGSTTLGTINLESTRHGFFTDEHVGFIKSLAGQATISINNARLLEASKRRIAVLTQLRTLAITASESQTTDEIKTTVIMTTIELMGGNGGVLIPYSEENNELEVGTLGWIKLGSGLVQDMFFVPHTLLYEVLRTGRILLITDTTRDETYQNYDQIEQVNYESIVILPITRRSHIVELLCITFAKQRNFDQQDYDTFELLQAQIANHIDGVMLAEEIRESNVRMRAILDSTRDGIILLDSDGRLQDANISAEELLNLELTRHRNKDFANLLKQNSYVADDTKIYEELIKSAQATHSEPQRNHIREYTFHTGGRPIYIREVSSPVWDNDNNIVGRLLSLRDISEERKLEEFRDRLIHMIVHDLRSPLANIVSSMGVGETHLEDIEDKKLRAEIAEVIDLSTTNANDLLELVNSILNIAKMQRNQMDLELKTESITDFATGSYTSLMTMFKTENITMKYDIPDDIPEIYVDGTLISRVFKNIVGNAIKYTPEGGEIRITAKLDEDNPKFVTVMISDTGNGIPKGMQDQIFSQYITANEEQKQIRGTRGIGLGLTFCKLAVESHGGHIYANNDGPLSGATFYFTLPVV